MNKSTGWYDESFLDFIVFTSNDWKKKKNQASPKRSEEWRIKRADKMVEFILNLEFGHTSFLYRSLITLFETAPKNKVAGMDHATNTKDFLFQWLCSHKTDSDQ